MFKSFRLLGLAVMAFTTLSVTSSAQEPAAQDPVAQAVDASLKPAEQEAARILLYSAALSKQMGEVVEIPHEVQKHYLSAAKSVAYSIPTGVTAVGTLYLFQSSLNEFKSIMDWVNVVIGYVATSFKEVARVSGESLKAIGVEYLARKSVDSSATVFDNFVLPVLKRLSTRGIRYAVGAGVGASSLSGSAYLIFNGPADTLKYETARELLGYNKHLNAEVDAKMDELMYVFNLKPSDITSVKDAVRKEIIEVAVKNDFRRDRTYHVDLIKVLASQKVLNSDHLLAAQALREIVENSTEVQVSEEAQARLGRSVAVILATQAMLDTMIESGKLTTETEKEARQMLGNSKRVVKRIHENLVQH